MKISLNLKNNFNLPIYCNLAALNDDSVFSSKHKVKFRHPADIFFRRFQEIVNSLNELKQVKHLSSFDHSFSSALTQYLLSIDSFYDNMFNIIVCLQKPTDGHMTTAIQWLKDNDHKEGDYFLGATLKHHRLISSTVNKIKHDDPEINSVTLTWDNGPKIDGFFIGSILDGKFIGPDPEIHKPYKGLSTAFSFNHFLLSTIGLVYLYSYELNKILFSKKKLYTNKKIPEFYQLAEFALNIEQSFFPDEFTRATAKLEKTENKIMIEFPVKYKRKKPKKDSWNINSSIRINQRTGEGPSKIPYLGSPEKT